MKQRLLVMNGQRLVQSEQGGSWHTDKVEKAGQVKPGIYNLYLSVPANKESASDGVIFYNDRDYAYQQCGKDYVKHSLVHFDRIPTVGSNCRIEYENDRAQVSSSANKLSRSIC